MRNERLLSINMAVLAVLGTLLLGMGQQDPKLPLLTLAVAVTSVVFTDARKQFQLNHAVANGAALVAVGLSLFDFTRFDRNQQLLAIANLLVYLQVVVLFQQKSQRVYWQLAMLSLLQVVVAAALNSSIYFGALLVVYLCVGLSALVLFFARRESDRFAAAAAGADDDGYPQRPLRRANGFVPIEFAAGTSGDLGETARGRTLAATITGIAIPTLALTVVIFFAVPRFGQSPWRAESASSVSMVGFSPSVTLGDLNEVIESPQLVMRVQFIDEETGEPLALIGEPLLRGAVVSEYQNRRWSHGTRSGHKEDAVSLSAPPGDPVVRQNITLEPLDDPVVFSIYPAWRLEPRSLIRWDRKRQQLFRRDELKHTQLSFVLGTTGIQNRQQYRITIEYQGLEDYELVPFRTIPKETAGGVDPLAGLKAAAADVVADAKVPPDDHYLVALALSDYLHTKGGFEYSLARQVRDPGVDPIEDFITNHRRGHCEYFASALTLMLRSQGIPARMVIGYKGGEWNSLGEFYQIRQLHAHTWVEAYLAPAQLNRREVKLLTDKEEDGGWLILDPTAAAGDSMIAGGVLARMGEMVDYVQMLWIRHVVGMNAEQQKESIYQPLQAAVAAAATGLFGSRDIWANPRSSFGTLRGKIWNWLGGNWFSWRGGLVGIILCLTAVGIYRLGRLVWRTVRGWVRRRRADRGSSGHMRVEFYRRLELLLARHGHRRPRNQTHREFATAMGGHLAASSHLIGAAPLPRRIVDAFYRVRFGAQPLNSAEADTIEDALATLETSLKAGRARIAPDMRGNRQAK